MWRIRGLAGDAWHAGGPGQIQRGKSVSAEPPIQNNISVHPGVRLATLDWGGVFSFVTVDESFLPRTRPDPSRVEFPESLARRSAALT